MVATEKIKQRRIAERNKGNNINEWEHTLRRFILVKLKMN